MKPVNKQFYPQILEPCPIIEANQLLVHYKQTDMKISCVEGQVGLVALASITMRTFFFESGNSGVVLDSITIITKVQFYVTLL